MTFEDLFQTVAAEGGEITLRFGVGDERRRERHLRIAVRMQDGKELTIVRAMAVRAAGMQRVRGAEERFHLRDAVCELGDVVAQRLLAPSRVAAVLKPSWFRASEAEEREALKAAVFSAHAARAKGAL